MLSSILCLAIFSSKIFSLSFSFSFSCNKPFKVIVIPFLEASMLSCTNFLLKARMLSCLLRSLIRSKTTATLPKLSALRFALIEFCKLSLCFCNCNLVSTLAKLSCVRLILIAFKILSFFDVCANNWLFAKNTNTMNNRKKDRFFLITLY